VIAVHLRYPKPPSNPPPVAAPRMKKWSMPSTTEVADYGIFRVRRSSVRDSSGGARRDVVTIACSDWCNVVAVTGADELVLVWQYRFGSDALSLEIPGGVVDPGEEPLEAARRELLEETGYAAGELELLLVVEPNPALQGNRCFTYVARGAERAGAPRFDEMEELEVALVPVSRLPDLLDEGHVRHSLVHAALEAFWRRGLPLAP